MAHVTRPTAHFSPHGGCTEAIVAALRQVSEPVYFRAYSFTSATIACAFRDAHLRGLPVRGIVDARMCNERGGQSHWLAGQGGEVTADASHPISHNKVIISGSMVITGSFNFTEQGESNAENLLIIHDPALAALYLADWDRHHGHAIPLPAPRVGAEPPWVEVAGSLAAGWRIHVNGAAVGPTVADQRDLDSVVRWLRAALGDLAGVVGTRDAEP